jgi:monofunctional chorismate mutase
MNLETLRSTIDKIDDQIIALFESRMAIVKDIGNIKKQSNANILDSNREAVVLSRVKNQLKNQTLEPYVIELFETLMRVSKAYQK